jgi:hypothetical protein
MRGKTRTETPFMFLKVMATPSLLRASRHGRENRIQAAEIRFLRAGRGCTREDRNENIRNVFHKG